MDQLSLYNDALLLAGERFIASLTEEREPRRLLDQVWASGEVNNCLENGQWNFAMRTMQIDFDSGVEPDFGFRKVFDKPDDWILTSALCADEYFKVPLLEYWDEANFWYADLDTIYVRFVSNDVLYGMNMNKWPGSFSEYVAEAFCSKIVRKLTGSTEAEESSLKRLKVKLELAKSRAAMAQPTSFPAQGNWSRARTWGGNRRDGGSSGSLIG